MMWRTQRATMSYMLLCHIVVRGWGLAGLGIYSCFHILSNIVFGGILIWLRNCMINNNRLNLSISNMNKVMVYCCFELSM